MNNVLNCDVRCFVIALRWVQWNKFPKMMDDWKPEHYKKLVTVINELHKRKKIDLICTYYKDDK